MTSHSQPPRAALRTAAELLDVLSGRADATAVLALQETGAERWTCTKLADNAERLARGLVEAGVRRGDHVVLLAENRPEWIVAALAVMAAGGVAVPLDAQLADKSLAHCLADSEARLVFTSADGATRIAKLDLKPSPKLLLLDAAKDDERSWQRLLSDKATVLPQVEPGDPATLFYTSGTTGAPKGVPLTHANVAHQLNMIVEVNLAFAGDRVLLPLPFHHVYPFVIGLLAMMAVGATIVLPHALTGPQLARALREGDVTIMMGVPRLYSALWTGIKTRVESAGRVPATLFNALLGVSCWLRRNLGVRAGKSLLRSLHEQLAPSLRIATSGGAALDAGLAAKLEDLGWQVAIGYGLTETAPLLTINSPGSGRLASAGQPVHGVEICIDPDAQPGETDAETPPRSSRERRGAKPGERGEILARGPNVFSGYRHLPDDTRKAFTADGWFRTGDLGYRDDDGFVYVLGRLSTMIVAESGKNIDPETVEDAYLASGVIREIGVLQVAGRLVAVIVPDPAKIPARNGNHIAAAIRKAVEERSAKLPSYQRITDYVIAGEPLERTRLGKLRRHKLAEQYREAKATLKPGEVKGGVMALEQMSPEDRALLENAAASAVWQWLAVRHPDKRLTPDTSPQLDLGVDSMAWLNLTLTIGQLTGVELNENAIARIQTVRDLLREVAAASAAGQRAPLSDPLDEPEKKLTDEQKQWIQPLGPLTLAWSAMWFEFNRLVMRSVFCVRAVGVENLPASGAFVLAPNHASYLDPFAVAAALHRRVQRQTYWAGWTGVAFGNAFARFGSRLCQVVPIDPERGVVSSLAFCAAVLRRGKNLVLFPEGERSASGRLLPFRPGIGILLHRIPAPVVPVFIHGSYGALPVGRALPRLKRITVVFGRPLDPRELERQGVGTEPHERITAALRARIETLGREPAEQSS
ncbi:MAG: AMP-binding protein [Verrucomicrobia bacterium]|nr:AMP-binding protein [Verrucomicrobiota bacterium]